MKDILNTINLTLRGLINLPIKKINRLNVTLRHLLLGVVSKKFLDIKALFVVRTDPGLEI